MSESDAVKRVVHEILAGETGQHGPIELEPLSNGGNNRVFKVCQGQSRYLVKRYFHDTAEARDRGLSEYRFSDFVWRAGIEHIPQPVGYWPEAHVGVFHFVEGHKLQAGDLQPSHIEQALSFFREINVAAQNSKFPAECLAAESCFSLSQHLSVLRERVSRLQKQIRPEESPEHEQAFTLVTTEFDPLASQITERVIAWASARGIMLDAEIAPRNRCLSPSDFGFHNAIVTPTSRVIFIDFEYAGWDDPAKMIGDFFCQPAVPVDRKYLQELCERCGEWCQDPLLPERAWMLLPLYQVKWCCIMLNEFLPFGGRRRAFAGHDLERRRGEQLSKVRNMLATITLA
jgi:hypothetical protein